MIRKGRLGTKYTGGFSGGSSFPLWRQGMSLGGVYQINGTASMSGLTLNYLANNSALDGGWNGCAGGGRAGYNKWWIAAGGGHSDWGNPTVMIDFAQDAPVWTRIDAGTVLSDVIPARYNRDGRPASCHEYYSLFHVRSSKSRDGKERVMRFNDWSPFDMASYTGSPAVNAWSVTDSRWETTGTYPSISSQWADCPLAPGTGFSNTYASGAQDPRNDDVYIGRGNQIQVFRAATDTYDNWYSYPTTGGVITPVYPNGDYLLAWNAGSSAAPSLVDAIRNRVVCIQGCDARAPGNQSFLQYVDLTTHVTSTINLSGTINNTHTVASLVGSVATGFSAAWVTGSGFTHDTDNDRYLLAIRRAVYAIDPATGVVTTLVQGPVGSGLAGDPGYFTRFAFFPDLHCVLWAAYYEGNIYAIPTT